MAGTMTVEDAAKALGIGRTLAYRLAREGQLPSIRLGRRLLIPVEVVDRMLADRATPTARGA